ncbi:sulfate ABC transporter substrate-binding protein [Methylopila henanensis]|uniref:Sulfate ABC transporter substrate-binding protein n=1 Tax=Methylopila henanensis TaxID=873516 RepID=A0ABW4K2T0_9HYPH
MKRFLAARLLAALTVVAPVAVAAPAAAQSTLTNVSYDPTRELYKDFNALFVKHWKAETGQDIRVQVSHGGSGKQARSVIDGLNADVVTLALASDIDAIAKATKKLPADWQKRLPNNSSPYTSTIVFLVRKGNPKGIKDWNDLVKPGVEVITPNPKTSGGARWNYLAAWAYGLQQNNNDPEKAKAFVADLFKHVPVLDSGARGSTTTFAQRGLGDVLLAWENEAYLSFQEFGDDKFEIVFPSISILAEPPVAIVDANVDKNGSRKAAEAYLNLLYSPEGQSLAAKHFYRPVKPETVSNKADVERFKPLKLVTIDDTFGGWAKAQGEHFGDGGVFDQIFKPSN